jgi:23S rRNA (cytosine1962-C5)-methyltransferase
MLAERLRQAAQLRDIPQHTNAYRICDGAADGLPGVFIDTFAGHWLVQTKNVPWPAGLEDLPQLGWQSLWWKRLDQEEKASPKHMAGATETQVVAQENGLRYAIDFSAGYSQGIFLDQRHQRAKLLAECRPGDRMLNLFAYTCGFSVAAAAAGAQTESIDLSRPYLDWGKRNFELNNLRTEGHFFCRGDSFAWLERLRKKGNTYQWIVLDPPTFSRSDTGKIWKAERDYSALVAAAASLLAKTGTMLCSTNHFGMSFRQFEAMIHTGIDIPQVKIVPGQMPADFRGERYLKTLWVTETGC